ncbi:MAG: signal peptidase II [Eubacteriales bacterium]|nr:signal peptidase II [Eubacteriales bacterium]
MLECIIIIAILALDQITKHLIQLSLSPVGSSMPVINGFLQLTNVHNTGAAWGMLEGFRWLFIPMTLIVAAVLIYVIIRFRKKLTLFSRITLALLFAGAVGNFIDRVALSYVRDFIDITPWFQFPVFNVADSALSVGCVLLLIDALFLKERSLFERVSFKNENPDPQKKEEIDVKNKAGDGSAADQPADKPHA